MVYFYSGTEKGLAGDRFEFHLLTDTSEVMPSHNARVRQKFARILKERGVRTHTDTRVVRVTERHIETEHGETIAVNGGAKLVHPGGAKLVHLM